MAVAEAPLVNQARRYDGVLHVVVLDVQEHQDREPVGLDGPKLLHVAEAVDDRVVLVGKCPEAFEHALGRAQHLLLPYEEESFRAKLFA